MTSNDAIRVRSHAIGVIYVGLCPQYLCVHPHLQGTGPLEARVRVCKAQVPLR